jgi:hypothetical protein
MEYDEVFQSVNGFPEIVNEFVFIRQMAVDAVFSPVCAGVHPCLVLSLHYMTTDAIFGFIRSFRRLRRSERQQGENGQRNEEQNEIAKKDCCAFLADHHVRIPP